MRRCPLCHAQEPALYHQDRRREYYQCATCALVFVPSEQHLSAADEKAEYDQHQNSPQDTGYRRFLGRLFNPLATKLAPGARGLDFGCGPGPTLSVMFEEAGFDIDVYDIFYAPHDAHLNRHRSSGAPGGTGRGAEPAGRATATRRLSWADDQASDEPASLRPLALY